MQFLLTQEDEGLLVSPEQREQETQQQDACLDCDHVNAWHQGCPLQPIVSLRRISKVTDVASGGTTRCLCGGLVSHVPKGTCCQLAHSRGHDSVEGLMGTAAAGTDAEMPGRPLTEQAGEWGIVYPCPARPLERELRCGHCSELGKLIKNRIENGTEAL